MSGQSKWREEQILIVCPGSLTTMAQLGCSELTPPAYRIPTRMFRDEETGKWRPYRTWKRRKGGAGGEADAASAVSAVSAAAAADEWEYVEDPDSDEGAVYPMEAGCIVHMEAFLAFLEHVHTLLTTTFHNTPIVLMASPQWTRPDCEAVALYIFEKTRTPALCMINSALATQYGLRWPHMTIVDIGYEKMDITCIYESRIVSHMAVGDVSPRHRRRRIGRGDGADADAADADTAVVVANAAKDDDDERVISGGEVFTRRLQALLRDKNLPFTHEMAEQLKKSALCEVLPYAPEHPKLMDLPDDGADAAAAAASAAAAAALAAADEDDMAVDDSLPAAVATDGVLDVATIVTSGQTKEFLAKKEREQATRGGRFGRGRAKQDKDAEAAASKLRLPNAKRARAVFHFEEVVEEDEQDAQARQAAAAAEQEKHGALYHKRSGGGGGGGGAGGAAADEGGGQNGKKSHGGSEQGSEDGSGSDDDVDDDDADEEADGEADEEKKVAAAPSAGAAETTGGSGSSSGSGSGSGSTENAKEESASAAPSDADPAAAAESTAADAAPATAEEPASAPKTDAAAAAPSEAEKAEEDGKPAEDDKPAPETASEKPAPEDATMEDAPTATPAATPAAAEPAAAEPAAAEPSTSTELVTAGSAAAAAAAAADEAEAEAEPEPEAEQQKGPRYKRVRHDYEIGVERFAFAERAAIDRMVATIYRTVQSIDDLYMRPACWENLVFVGNGSRLRGLRENILQTLHARHLVSPSTATIFTSELPSHMGTPSGTGSQTPTGGYGGGTPHQLPLPGAAAPSSGVNPLLQAATTASLVQQQQQQQLYQQQQMLGGGSDGHHAAHHFHAQTPTAIKLAALPTYLSEWTKNGFEEAMFLGAQVAARLAFCVHNLDAQGQEFQRQMSLTRTEYNELGPKGIRTHSMLG